MRAGTALFTAAASLVALVAEASVLRPPVLPLLVRNPYLNTWLADARREPWREWPMFWKGEHQGFAVMVNVPAAKTVYPLLGRPQDSLSYHDEGYHLNYPLYYGAHYDASTTNLSYTVPSANKDDPVIEITLSFLSPITPTSTLRQSIPISYLTVYVSGHSDVDVYVDLNGQFASGDRGSTIEWEMNHQVLESHIGGIKTWAFRRQVQERFVEFEEQAEWGTMYFSAPFDVRHESGISSQVRRRFSRTGTLQNENDDNPRGIMEDEPIFAFAKSFQANESTMVSGHQHQVTFTIGFVQDPALQFEAARGRTMMQPFWKSYIPSDEKLIAFHYQDFANAKILADQYSAQLAEDAYKSGAEDYVDIVSLSARQVMGATCFVGTPDDPLLFMKEISSDGNMQTIDVIYPSFPFFMYTNPRWLAYLLEPLIEHMGTGKYPNKYAMHDLGSSYPNATGHPEGDDEKMPVEECGNILIMGMAMANAIRYDLGSPTTTDWTPMEDYPIPTAKPSSPSHRAKETIKEINLFPLEVGISQGMHYIDDVLTGGDTSQSLKRAKKWIKNSYRLWNQWTQYLVDFSLRPENQLSTDDFAGPLALQTNLALKGIIGIKAMAGLSDLVGDHVNASKYNKIAENYIGKWEEYALSRDKTHLKLAYDWYGSWTTLYNLFADSLLCFHLSGNETASPDFSLRGSPRHGQARPKDKVGFVPRSIYQKQSDWYYLVRQKYGLPLDSRHYYTKNDWEFFAMAVAAPNVRAEILESVAKWVNETKTDRPLTDLHDTEGKGGFPGPNFFNRPVVGGHFAFLALERSCGGRAMDGLQFLKRPPHYPTAAHVPAMLADDRPPMEGGEVQYPFATDYDLPEQLPMKPGPV